GKSVCTNSIVISLLYRSSPEQVRLIMIDPKIVEFEGYNGIPHLLIPVVTDPKKAAGALQWAVTEMLKRYRLFAERHVRDLEGYNQAVKADPDTDEKPMPRIVVIIDELADLMLVASKEVEESICRLAQMGRASGMHLIIATQRPSADVITGLMKANIPSRIALTVSSGMESRIILDVQGAEKLLGHGDMLYNPVGANKPTRVQGCFISDEEVAAVVSFVKSNSESNYDDTVLEQVEQNAENTGKTGKKGGGSASAGADSAVPAPDPGAPTPDDGDPMMNAAIDVVVETGMASVSSLQRKLKLGYSRAARLVDQMEEIGVVGPFEGSKPRKVLITKEQWTEMKMRGGSLTELDQAKAMSEESDREAMAAEDVEMPPFEV
ncbi:MAG: DNA translocase FtsK, partial [Oscillospiraceae bacterium]|nr:DNA translocase FtsK [Oscillospiraceae bacterium]